MSLWRIGRFDKTTQQVMKVKASDLVAQFLAERGMRRVFGIIGAAISHVFDSIHNLGRTEIVCVHHEQAAAMAMQTYYRVGGVPTASIVTAGGGSSNPLTGLVSAYMDSMPGLVISGQENSKFARPDNTLRVWGIQGFDSVEAVRKVTKYAVRVMDPARIVYEFEKAYFIATSGRPGPCWIDLPMNVQSALVETDGLAHFSPEKEGPRFLPPIQRGPELAESVRAACRMLREAKRPVLWLGHGIRLAGADAKARSLLELAKVPSLVTWAVIDMIDSDHPLVYGRAGNYGQRAANFVLQNADFVLGIGTRMPLQQVGYDIGEFVRGGKVAVVDIDPAEIAKYRERYALAVCADAGEFLSGMLEELRKSPCSAPRAWIERCDDYRRRYPWVGPEHADKDGYINSYRFMEKLVGHFHPDQVVVTDMGTALLSGHQVLRLKPPQRLMTSLGLGEMGYGLPGAIGASFARGKGEVLCLNCDGGMMMNLQELQTVAHHKLPIKLVVFSNDGYLMIRHTQDALFSGRRVASDAASGVTCAPFGPLAKAFGMPYFQIRTWKDFDDVLPKFQALQGPSICEVFMHPDQPFVPKLSMAVQEDGSLVSPPLEDLSPLLPREEMRADMIIGLHPKSEKLKA